MATRRFIGNAQAVADVWTFTPTASNNATYTITCNGKSVTYTADASATVAEITAGLVAAASASTAPEEFGGGTWTDATTLVRFTGTVAGRSHSFSSTASAGALTASNATAASGPNWLNVAANWSGATLPVDGDTVIFDIPGVNIDEGLDLSAVTPAAIKRYQSFTGQIGLPEINEDGYTEYRTKYAKFGNSGDAIVMLIDLGLGEGNGPSLERWDFGSSAATINIYGTGQPSSNDQKACQISGSGAIDVNITSGSVAFAQLATETAAIDELRISYESNQESDVDLYCGPGCTINTVIKSGGLAEFNSLIDTSLTNDGGETVINGTGNVDQLTIRGGKVYYNTSGTLGGNTIVSVEEGLDFSRDPRTKTVTNPIESTVVNPVVDPFKVVSSLIIDFNQIVIPNYGGNVRLTRGTPS